MVNFTQKPKSKTYEYFQKRTEVVPIVGEYIASHVSALAKHVAEKAHELYDKTPAGKYGHMMDEKDARTPEGRAVQKSVKEKGMIKTLLGK